MSDQRPAKLSFTPEGGKEFFVQYNPTQMKVSKGIEWKDAETFGAGKDMLQFTRPKPMTISMELTFDTTFEGITGKEDDLTLADRMAQGAANVAAAATSAASSLPFMGGDAAAIPDGVYPDVRTEWIDHLEAMTYSKNTKGGKADKAKWSSPPVILVEWNKLKIEAVITKLDKTFTMFGSDGAPIRATVSLELKEQKLRDEIKLGKQASPMLAKKVQLLNPDHGENVFSLAMKFGLDWRMIALANNIDDPTDIADNMDLIIPMVTGGKI
jgi:hypothetical protein